MTCLLGTNVLAEFLSETLATHKKLVRSVCCKELLCIGQVS